jgi:hypothetical protein
MSKPCAAASSAKIKAKICIESEIKNTCVAAMVAAIRNETD